MNYTDLLLERGSKELSRTWNIPLDTNWTTRFHMDGRDVSAADRYFYEPWRAGTEYADADTAGTFRTRIRRTWATGRCPSVWKRTGRTPMR